MDTTEKENSRDSLRMKELINVLNRASEAYYAHDTEIMSNLEYDRLYDELTALEKKTGITLASSPTVHVGYESVEELPKEHHEKPMLSLDKTKSREELRDFLQGHEGLLSWKLDGLTIVLTYQNGKLLKAVTRGNGEIGEVVTANARAFQNIPLSIPYTGNLILRGEAVIKYSDFRKINEQLEEDAVKRGEIADVRYKNPRNLCSGSVRQLDSHITARRKVHFYAFTLVDAPGVDFHNSREEQFRFLQRLGFETVAYRRVSPTTILGAVEVFEEEVKTYDVPSDGLVLLLDDIAYGESLGMTAKFPRNSIAFKWKDELQETTLLDVEWSASRTGLINPVAVFTPVELEGTTVQRASVHNVSIVRELKLGIGDRITVYKANMIIPQIAEDLTRSGNLEIPDKCPVCGERTEIRQENETEALFCVNPDCPAKRLKSFVLFASRNAMNIDGLSEMTLEKFIARGFIHSFPDIYHLFSHKEEIMSMDGFGEKSYDKLINSIETSRETVLSRVIYALGIPGIGAANARLLCAYFQDDLDRIREAQPDELSGIDGIGPVLAQSICDFFADPAKSQMLDQLLKEIHITKTQTANPDMQTLSGLTFVITGKVTHFANRDALKEYIRSLGGRAAGSVSSKTDYLINNDVASASAKNKKARELGIPILSEEDFLKLAGGEEPA